MWGYLCCFVVFCSSSLCSQTLLQEDFEYPADDSLASHGWVAHASANTNPVKVVEPGLVYNGHPGSGTGNAARLFGPGQDVNRSITGLTNANVYVSLLVLVNDATTGSDEYFLHFNTGTHAGKVFVRKAGGLIAFGLSKSSDAAVFTEAGYSLGTVYLIVVQYSHVSGSANDTARLFLAESGIPAMESDPVLGPITSSGSEPSEINALALRQGLSSVPDVIVDAIRVSTSWNEAGLPVTLSMFTAQELGGEVVLRWRTESEVGNYGFDIERRVVSGSKFQVPGPETLNLPPEADPPSAEKLETEWIIVGFLQGAGTSSSPRDYSFVDKPDWPGRYAYRIKQIDHSGVFTYASSVEVEVGFALPEFSLAQNFPNPFNPTTTIRFFLKDAGNASVSLYDMVGRAVGVVAEGKFSAGWNEVMIDAGGLPSGTYILRLEVGGQAFVRKVALVK